MGLSPCSQPQSAPPFFVHGGDTSHGLNASTPSTMSGGFVPGHRPSVPHDQPWSNDGEGSDWDDDDDNQPWSDEDNEMWRGANNNGAARVVVDGEVHVERVERIEVVVNGVPPPPTTAAIVLPPPRKAGRGPPATAASGKAAVPDVNKLAEEFIRRNRAAFQGGIVDDHGQEIM
ncbi:hypothetical protein C2845_PM05G12080 [Panicum miliaceum]|uniref:Uncharacterized protein n=1 Tax=Panicum miliaceum TaxID=4540 RepID=A0A3L6SY65_PANMI|nr:hypothetical protein C2845_PM05G12080 [Panicum miliaceum]